MDTSSAAWPEPVWSTLVRLSDTIAAMAASAESSGDSRARVDVGQAPGGPDIHRQVRLTALDAASDLCRDGGVML
jgi:hypothetical protein